MQREFKQPKLGSGFIIDKEGHVVTNNHRDRRCRPDQSQLDDQKEFDAQVIVRDAEHRSGAAENKIDLRIIPTVKTGGFAQLKVGQWVVAIGSPFGLERTVTPDRPAPRAG